VKEKRGGGLLKFLRERLLSFGMVLAIGFLLLTSLILTTALAAFSDYLDQVLRLPPAVWGVAGFLISFCLVTTLFALIFKVLPDAEVPWRHVWIGAVLTALLFEIGKSALGWYLGRESTASGFGAAGAIVLLLLWVYFSSAILYFGAEFTRACARDSGPVRPAANAVAVTSAERAQEGLESTAARRAGSRW
jgi:membrane protein